MTQELIERLRARRKRELTLSLAGVVWEPLVNPDGPEAASALQSQSARIAELEGLVKLAQQLGPRAAQLMDSIRQEWSQSGDWTEWDQRVRDETTAMMRAIDLSLTKDSTSATG